MAVKLIPPQQNNALGLLGSNNPFSSGSLLQGSRLDVDPNLQTRTSSFNSLAELERFNQENQPGARKNKFFKGLRDLGLALQGVNPTAYDVQQQQLLQAQEDENRRRQLIASLPEDIQRIYGVYGPEAAYKAQYGTAKAKPTSYQEYALTDDTPTREEYVQFLQGKKSSVSDPLRTITMGGKVIKNVRDSELTPEFIKEINESGQVVQPLGFTEKFESSKDVDFAPIKSKYLATQNIIIKTSELAEKFATEPSSALAVGKATQFVDGIIKNIDAGGEILSKAKDTKVYKYIQNTSTSLEGKDFTSKIADASKASGVAESRIRDLAYLFAAARGQTGRGLSDKDYENALKIVTGGVGASGRIAVLEDVATGLRDEFYRDIDFDIDTSENESYVNRLKGLPQLPSFINPFTQVQPQSNNNQNDDVPRIRISL